MTPEWIYLLKVNTGIALFYAFYKLFCQRDTFFQWRRTALICFLGISFLYPLLNIQHWVKEQPTMYELANYYATFIALDEPTVSSLSSTAKIPSLMTLAGYIYLIGVIALSLRFLIQLLSILRMRWIGKATHLNGQRIISLPVETNPFSFFGWIFIYLPQLNKESQNEILTHEQTHARQWHSIDVIISEIINIICWFNPFMWLMKTEIRLNLEYLADHKVIENTADCKQYQYHLLGLAHTNRQTGLYNNFNVSHLKCRIIMMNKKRTRTAGRIKYALFAPLATALLLVSNIEAVARTVEKAIKELPSPTTTVPQDKPKQEPIVMICDETPEFPGGMGECMKFLGRNINYPAEAMAKEIEGRVVTQMIIEKDGSISNAKIVRSVHPLLDQEALRVVESMPKWTPGKVKGQAVRVRYTLPVKFSLKKNYKETIQHHQAEILPDENGIYAIVEDSANYPGGFNELIKWLQANIQYPDDCKKEKIGGRVITKFLIDKDGSIKEAKILRGIHPSLDQEALRVINTMPKWNPGKVKGEPVVSQFVMPVVFSI